MPRRYAPLAIALLTVVLLASGCARLAAPVSRTPSLAPVATPPPPSLSVKPARPVVWTAHQIPPALNLTECYLECPAIAQSDGALLAVTPNPVHGESPTKLLRVTPGQSAWESLGALPVRDATLATYAAGGTLWLLKPSPNYRDAVTTEYTATYP
jgi:hypothetical protein